MDKLKSSICFSCCFRSSDVAAADDRSLSWIQAKAERLPSRCRGLVSRMGKSGNRRHHQSEFRYDAFSYALNFDEGPVFDDDDPEIADFKFRDFASRLPSSPPNPTPARAATKEVACS